MRAGRRIGRAVYRSVGGAVERGIDRRATPCGGTEPHGEAAHGADAVGVVDLVSARWAND